MKSYKRAIENLMEDCGLDGRVPTKPATRPKIVTSLDAVDKRGRPVTFEFWSIPAKIILDSDNKTLQTVNVTRIKTT